MASLWSDYRHECGAVILAPDLLLTAAHCIQNGVANPNMLIQKAILGRWNLNDPFEAGTVTITTGAQHMHTEYNPGTDEHDIGIIELTSSTQLPWVKINSSPDFVAPLAASSTANVVVPAGQTLTSLGWGDLGTFVVCVCGSCLGTCFLVLTHDCHYPYTVHSILLGNGTFPDKLQEVHVKVMSNSACRNAPDPWNSGASYQDYIYNDMICATDEGKDGCFGDSGGPLLFEGGPTHNDDVVVGITSWGIGCARMPGVYSRTAHPTHWDWISSQVCTLSANPPGYFGCNNGPSSTIRDDGFPILEPITEEPSVAPSSAPTRRPTVISNDDTGPAPTYAYTWGVTIPPVFEGASTVPPPSASPTLTQTGRTSSGVGVWSTSSKEAVPPTDAVVSAASATETSDATSSWLTVSSSLLLMVSAVVILAVAI